MKFRIASTPPYHPSELGTPHHWVPWAYERFYFVSSQKPCTGQNFPNFSRIFSNFSPSRKFFRRPKIFSKFSWHRCDSFGPKIVKIGAILTVFRPFEISRKFVPYKLLQNFLCGYKIEMAIWFIIKDLDPWIHGSAARAAACAATVCNYYVIIGGAKLYYVHDKVHNIASRPL